MSCRVGRCKVGGLWEMLDASFFFGVDWAVSLGLRFYEVCT